MESRREKNTFQQEMSGQENSSSPKSDSSNKSTVQSGITKPGTSSHEDNGNRDKEIANKRSTDEEKPSASCSVNKETHPATSKSETNTSKPKEFYKKPPGYVYDKNLESYLEDSDNYEEDDYPTPKYVARLQITKVGENFMSGEMNILVSDNEDSDDNAPRERTFNDSLEDILLELALEQEEKRKENISSQQPDETPKAPQGL